GQTIGGARGHINVAIGTEHCTSAGAAVARPDIAHQDVFHINNRAVDETAAGQRGGHVTGIEVDVLGVGEIDVLVLFKVRVQKHFHQTGKPYGVDRRNSGDGIRVQLAVTHDADLPGT